MQSFLVALVTAAIATQNGALPAPAMAAAVLDEGLVSVDIKAVVPTPTSLLTFLLRRSSTFALQKSAASPSSRSTLRRVTASTTDASEIEAGLASGQYVREFVLASVYSNTTGPNVPNAIPLYKLHSVEKTDHFLTTSFEEVQSAVNNDGYTYQGITAYVYPAPQAGCAGTVPLYRQYNPTIVDHQYGLTKPFDRHDLERVLL